MEGPLLVSLASGLGGVILTLVLGVVGAQLSSKNEHAKWLRNERLKAYLAFLTAASLYLDSTVDYWEAAASPAGKQEQHRQRASQLREELGRAQSAVVLLGPTAIRETARDYHLLVEDEVAEAQAGTFEEAMKRSRADLAASYSLLLGVMNRVLGIRP